MPDDVKSADHIGQGGNGEQQEAVYPEGMRERLY